MLVSRSWAIWQTLLEPDRRDHEADNSQQIVIAGFFTGGALAVRGGMKAARNSAIGCACLLAVIEGVGIGFQRMMAENTRLDVRIQASICDSMRAAFSVADLLFRYPRRRLHQRLRKAASHLCLLDLFSLPPSSREHSTPSTGREGFQSERQRPQGIVLHAGLRRVNVSCSASIILCVRQTF